MKKGFGLVGILIIIGIVTVGGGGYYLLKDNNVTISDISNVENEENEKVDTLKNEDFSIKVKNIKIEEDPFTTNDTLEIYWSGCRSGVNIQLVKYIENSPHKTESFVIGENIEATSFEYKIEPRIPSDIYRIWFGSNECGIGEYSDFIYITNIKAPFAKITSPDQNEKLYKGTPVKIRWYTEKKDQGRVRLGYRSPQIGKRSDIHWITDYILARGYYDWIVPQNLLIDAGYIEIIIEDQETGEITGVVVLI
jgi:hypothetical protein